MDVVSLELILSQNFSNVNALWRMAHNRESSSSMLHETDRERYGSVCAPVNGVTWYLARYNGYHPSDCQPPNCFSNCNYLRPSFPDYSRDEVNPGQRF